MYLAYVDESGNVGAEGGSHTFTLGCVLVEAHRWHEVFDGLISYRRFLNGAFGVPVRAELKANFLLRNGGPFRRLALSEMARHSIYRSAMRIQPKLGLKSFAIMIRKDALQKRRPGDDPRVRAWTFLYQRFETFTRKAETHVMVFHDEGDAAIIRQIARKHRRAGMAGSVGGGSRKLPAYRVIDDPCPRRSHESYFVQLADLNAYAAFRRIYPPSTKSPLIVPSDTWDALGDAIMGEVNIVKGGPPGIVCWPDE
jgi:hypothetical protein